MIPLPKYWASYYRCACGCGKTFVGRYRGDIWLNAVQVSKPLDHTTFTLEDCR